jgi:hypothetical protein
MAAMKRYNKHCKALPAPKTNAHKCTLLQVTSLKDVTAPKAAARPFADPRKDALRPGDPACEQYFLIRRMCTDKDFSHFDDVKMLQKLLPKRVFGGRDFTMWPRQHLLLHGMAKAGCTECVKYLVNKLNFDVNSTRSSDKCTPLHMAHYHLQGKPLRTMCNTLLRLNANEKLKNKWGELPGDSKTQFSPAPPTPMHAPMRSPLNAPMSPLQSPCGVADAWLDAPKLTDFALGPSASTKKSKLSVEVKMKISPLPSNSAESPTFVPKGDAAYMSFCLLKETAMEARDPRACAWVPASKVLGAPSRQAGTPAGDLYLAVRRAAGALLPPHQQTIAA